MAYTDLLRLQTDVVRRKAIPSMLKLPWYKNNRVLVPMHLHDDFHWVLAVIELPHKLITCYDSLQVSVLLHHKTAGPGLHYGLTVQG